MPSIDIEDYSSKYLNHYDGTFNFEKVLIDVRRRQVIASMKRYSHLNILEIGCGLEPAFLFFDDYKNYTVVEPSEQFVKNAKVLCRDKKNITIVRGFFEEVSERLASTKKFDFIILSSLLHEVLDPERLLRCLYALADPTTVIHLNVPNVYSFHRLLAYEMGLIADIHEKSDTETKFQRHQRFDKQSLLAIVESHGFDVLTFGTYFIKPFTHEQMEEIISKKILDLSAIHGLEKMVKYMPELGAEMFVEMRKRRRNG